MSSAVRWAGLILLLWPDVSLAQGQDDPTAQDYIRNAKRNLGMTPREDCGQPDKDGAIIVCGRRGPDPNRIPLPEERDDLAGKRVLGEIPRATTAKIGGPGCNVVGQTNQCNGGVNALAIAGFAVKLLTKIIDPEAEVEPPATIPRRLQGSNK